MSPYRYGRRKLTRFQKAKNTTGDVMTIIGAAVAILMFVLYYVAVLLLPVAAVVALLVLVIK